MAASPETGFLGIDLTGYTAYLSQSELEHAPGSISNRSDRGERESPTPGRSASPGHGGCSNR